MIVLSGKKRSGKDTVANFMKEEGLKTYALADPIKSALLNAFTYNFIDMSMDKLNGIDYDRESVLSVNTNEVRLVLLDAVMFELRRLNLPMEEYVSKLNAAAEVIKHQMAPYSVRKFMQVFGTDIMCNTISNRHWLNQIPSDDVIITDVRQPWEEEFFREKNANFVFVIGAYEGYKESTDSHITEQGLTPKDGDEILINKNLETLAKETKCLLKKLMN